MGDVVRYTEGAREYAVFGLDSKAWSVRTVARAAGEDLERVGEAARAAQAEWRGPHSATMAAQHNELVGAVAAVQASLSTTAARIEAFPGSFTPAGYIGQGYAAQRQAAEVTASHPDGTVAAAPAELRSYAAAATGSTAPLPNRAATVSYQGLRAEVTYGRSLTADEVDRRLGDGIDPRVVAEARIEVTEPYPVQELITLSPPTDEAQRAVALGLEASDFSQAVAQAFAAADSTLLDLLARHPELAGFVVEGGAPDVFGGDTALAVLQAHFGVVDVADEGGDPDDNISRDDLEAVAADASLPAELQAAAQYLLDNPTLYALVDTGADDRGPLAADDNISRDDLDQFLVANGHLRTLRDHVDQLDVADADGYVSRNDLEAAAEDLSLPPEVRVAAQYLLDHDGALRSVTDQEEMYRNGVGDGGFTTTDLLGRLVNGQAYVHDPDAAREFVGSLPTASGGDEGLPVAMSGDDSVRALANSALISADGDLTDMQVVISHLPESPGAVRNQLITTYYDMLAQRVDGVATDQWGIPGGDPTAPGSGGANWLVYAPWASEGVRSAIDGSFSVWGQGPSWTQRQAAADGNQWIFNDITARFATFVELYEDAGGRPTTAELERFFDTSFDEGDAEIRQGFEAYVAALGEEDPTRRQELMFQANTLVATHEQAGAQPYLDGVMSGPSLYNTADLYDGEDGVDSSYLDPEVADAINRP